jgi:hypothetical protein
MGKNIKNQKSIREEIEIRLDSLLSFDADLLSSSLLSKNVKIKIYRNVILPVVLYGCETWSLTLTLWRQNSLLNFSIPCI